MLKSRATRWAPFVRDAADFSIPEREDDFWIPAVMNVVTRVFFRTGNALSAQVEYNLVLIFMIFNDIYTN